MEMHEIMRGVKQREALESVCLSDNTVTRRTESVSMLTRIKCSIKFAVQFET
jgi:hypothetical protein